MSFTEIFSNASSLKNKTRKPKQTNKEEQRKNPLKTETKKEKKTQTAERSNRKFPGRRSRHPLKKMKWKYF